MPRADRGLEGITFPLRGNLTAHVAFGSFTADAFSTNADQCPLLLR